MAGETVITIVGNLTADPELRTTRNGSAVANSASPQRRERSTSSRTSGLTGMRSSSAVLLGVTSPLIARRVSRRACV